MMPVMNHIEIPVSGFRSTSRALIDASRRNAAPPRPARSVSAAISDTPRARDLK
jgi:hypothetical protein